jgi:AraC-like DNA-binding protein
VSGSLTHRLVQGEVLVLNSSAKAKIAVPDKGEIVFWYFSLCLEHLFPLFASNEICLLQNVTDSFKGIKTYSPLDLLAKQCHRLLGEVPPQFNLDHRSQLLRVVGAILTVEFKTAQPQRVGFVRVEEHMIQVFEKLSTAELLSLSVGELAAKFSCSRRHLNRLFHQHFGFSVASLRMEMRLLKAVSLLRDPDVKVINVAEQCGFNHLGLFNTCFKRRFGTSPGQWRKMGTQAGSQSGSLVDNTPVCPLRTNGLCPWSGKPEEPKTVGPEAPRIPTAAPPRAFISANGQPESCVPPTNSFQPQTARKLPNPGKPQTHP